MLQGLWGRRRGRNSDAVATHSNRDEDGGALRRELLSAANDGIISAAAIEQGLLAAGATGPEAVVGVLALMAVGALTAGGTVFGEVSSERGEQLAVIEDERRRLALTPDEELEELAGIYQAKGLSVELSHQVARELHAKDALAAQLDAEFDIDNPIPWFGPWRIALLVGLAFLVGAAIPLLLLVALPGSAVLDMTFVVVTVSLVISGWIGSRSEYGSPLVAIGRTVLVGLVVLGISTLAGSMVSF